jgi:hypothetical protein
VAHFHRRQLLTLAALIPAVALLVPSGDALAAIPAAGISYNGTSAHGLYAVAITTSCVANDTTVSAVCVQPSYLDLTVTPTAKIGPKCNAYGGLGMGYIGIKPDGSFKVNDYSADNYNVTVTGQFSTSRTVKGLIKNIGFGCASDTFDITIPTPVSPLSPCEMLTKVHAVRVIGAGQAATIIENTFTNTSGVCTVSVARINDLELVVSTSRSTLPIGIGGMQVKALAGPGTAATLYAAANGNFFQAIVIFHHGTGWAGLSYDYQHSPCPSSTPVGTSCVTKAAQSSVTAHVESSARQIYTLL